MPVEICRHFLTDFAIHRHPSIGVKTFVFVFSRNISLFRPPVHYFLFLRFIKAQISSSTQYYQIQKIPMRFPAIF